MATKRKPAKATPRIDAQGGSKTDAVIAAAIRLVDAEGESALGWNRLAQELGVKPPSLYNHVSDAADLMRRVAIFAWSELERETAIAFTRATSSEDQLRAIATSYRSFARRRPGLFAIASKTRIPLDDRDFVRVSAALFALFDAPLVGLGIPATQQVHAIRILRASVHGFVELERAGQFAMSTSVEETFAALLEVLPTLISGLRR
jgi:AcrR family transcriptional regulator